MLFSYLKDHQNCGILTRQIKIERQTRMKKILLTLLSIIFLTTLSGCDWFTQTPTVRDIGIEVTEITKISYEIDEAFDLSTIIVSVVQSDGNKIVIGSTRYTITGFDSSVSGLQQLTFTYGDFDTSLWIVILEPAPAPVELAITITPPSKLVYAQNEMIDLTGLVVRVIVSNGTVVVLKSSEYTVTGFSSATAGTKSILVTYKTFTARFSIVINEEVVPLTKVSLEITPPTKLSYEINESINLTGLGVKVVWSNGSKTTLTSSEYMVTSVTLNQAGPLNVFVAHLDLEASFQIIVNANSNFITMEYYEDADGLVGNALLLALRTILNRGFVPIEYGAARYILNISDRDPNNANNVILVYRGTSVNGTWDDGITWNREHVWPQSLLGVSVTNTTKNAGSDLQNLKPANPSENSSRGNKYFDNTLTTVSYVPRNEVKGDVARILFYMVAMYNHLELVNRIPNTYEMAWFNTLLSWHEQDPVDDFERNRNEVIATHQKNRNPFIDYPEFVNLIWGNPN